MTDRRISEVQALKLFFGHLPGESGAAFLEEVRELDPETRHAFAEAIAETLGLVLEGNRCPKPLDVG